MHTFIKKPLKENMQAKCSTLKIFYLFISVSFSSALALLPLDNAYNDRQNYLIYAENSSAYILNYLSDGWLSFLANEPLWLALNSFIRFFFEPQETVRLIIFISSLTLFVALTSKYKRYPLFILLLVLMPQVLSYYITGLRQGLAISVFIYVFLSSKSSLKVSLATIVCCFIHSSFFFVAMLYFSSLVYGYIKLPVTLRLFFTTIQGILIVVALGPLVSLLGARQADSYQFENSSGSGLALIFWSFILSIFLLSSRARIKSKYFEISSILFYLIIYFNIEVSGRIFESTIAIVFLAMLSLERDKRTLSISVTFIYFLIAYGLRLGEPWLGFKI